MRVAFFVSVLVLAESLARAEPQVSSTEIQAGFQKLVVTVEEPAGLLANEAVPSLGIERGDIVLTVSGVPAIGSAFPDWRDRSVVTLDVLRNGKPVTVRIAHQFSPLTMQTDRDGWMATYEGLSASWLVQLTTKGVPSGVLLSIGRTAVIAVDERPGDIIRSINGRKVTTVAQVRAALLDATKRTELVVGLERAGRTFTATVTFAEPQPPAPGSPGALVLAIKKRGDSKYDVPKALIDAFIQDPKQFLDRAYVVPSSTNGVMDGYIIRKPTKGSLFAALGLNDRDRVWKVNGVVLDNFSRAYEVLQQLPGLRKLELQVVRSSRKVVKYELWIK